MTFVLRMTLSILVVLKVFSGAATGEVLRGDPGQLERGLQVYNEVCSACHGMGLVRFRDLAAPGGPLSTNEQVRAIAEYYEVEVPTPDGDLVFLTATPRDFFPENRALAAPDFSLLALGVGKRTQPLTDSSADPQTWRADPEAATPWWLDAATRLRALLLTGAAANASEIEAGLLGYTGQDREDATRILYENPVFAGGWTTQPPVLYGDDILYRDGTEATVEQMSADVAAFMVWAATPKVQSRQKTLVHIVLLFATLLTTLALTRGRLW